MQNNTKFILKEFLRFVYSGIITIVLLLLIFGVAHMDIAREENIPELSLTEVLQELILFLCTGIFCLIAHKNRKPGLWLAAGLLCCMFIRELDILFDFIFHGAWKYIALPAAVFFIFLALKSGIASVLADLAHFIKSKNYGFLFLGLLLIFIVSRMLGSLELIALLEIEDSKSQYLIKNFLEESTELSGYFLLLLSSCSYYYECYKEHRKEMIE